MRAKDIYTEARRLWQQETNNFEASWQLGRACFDWAEFAANNTQRAALAEEGIAACRQAIHLQPKRVEGHYYLALNLGQMARTKLLGALSLLNEMEAELKTAIELDPTYDYSGPHRALSFLYRDAPGPPISIGSRQKARALLEKAVEQNPEYPGNQLALLEAYLKWGDKKTAQARVNSVEEILKEARQKFTGERWEADWQEWEGRWAKVKASLKTSSARSPRDQR
jgi:tetratricopeptide (TPR) repeat protein